MKNDMNQKILEMWEQGKSGSEIANVLGVTRSTVLGRINRLRRKHKIEYRAAKILVKSDRVVRTRDKAKPYKKLRVFVPVEQVIPKPKNSVSILDLQYWSCRYVLGDPKTPLDKIYCGQISEQGSYCKDHAQLCYQPVQINAKRPHSLRSPA